MTLCKMLFVSVTLQQVATGFASEPDASEPMPHATVSVNIPADFPVGLATIIPGRLNPTTLDGSVFRLANLKQGSPVSYAQKEAATGQVWLFTQIDQGTRRGETVKFRVTPSTSDQVVTIEERQDGLQFLDEGRPVMFYQRSPKSDGSGHTSANYVHPVWGLNGEVVTQDFPSDHPHHHGVFWAWHQLWVGEQRTGDPWVNKDFLPVVKRTEVLDQGPVFAKLRTTVVWTSPLFLDDSGSPRPIVEEVTQIRVFHATAQAQYLDFETAIRPLVDGVKIGGSENARGYSGFTVRVKPPGDMQIVDTKGILKEDRVGTFSRWADVSGRFGAGDAISGVAILGHRSLPEFPPRWLLRKYGMQNVAYPGREPISLSRQRPLVLRHRLVIHRGNVHNARIKDHQAVFESYPTEG